jgi:hypothetical protein
VIPAPAPAPAPPLRVGLLCIDLMCLLRWQFVNAA